MKVQTAGARWIQLNPPRLGQVELSRAFDYRTCVNALGTQLGDPTLKAPTIRYPSGHIILIYDRITGQFLFS